jgi:hypothetical protein
MKSKKLPFDEGKLTPAQREALAIAKAQGAKPVHSLRELKLGIEPEELEEFARTLDEISQDVRRQPVKDRF